MPSQRCIYNPALPCGDAQKILMFRDYVHYAAEKGLSDIFFEGCSCGVDPDWCPYYNQTVCRYNNLLICGKADQLTEFVRQNPTASVDADKWDKCMCNPGLCARYLANEKQK